MTHTRRLISTDVRYTRRMAQQFGQVLTEPLVIALNGAMGVGKTVFAQGLARGLDVSSDYYVTSPTYTLVHEYPGRLTFVHADFYRLTGLDQLDDVGIAEWMTERAVVAIEWAQKIDAMLPDDYLAIDFQSTGEQTRQLTWRPRGANSKDVVARFWGKRDLWREPTFNHETHEKTENYRHPS